MLQYAWTCASCGKQHSGLPLDFSVDAPAYWLEIPEAERAARGVLTSDFCSIDAKYHFVRGCLEVPIIGTGQALVFGVWSSLSEASMGRAVELFERDPPQDEPPRFGWLNNNVKTYPCTLELKLAVHFRPNRQRPRFELEPTDHPLAVDQRSGIPLEKAEQIVAALMPTH